MSSMQNPAKIALRSRIKKILAQMTVENRQRQSQSIREKLFENSYYKSANRVSLYLSTTNEVDTTLILKDLFARKKQVFVPTYTSNTMQMVKLNDFEDYLNLPLTKWNIRQPNPNDSNRENCLETDGLNLILLPGVAFTLNGSRCGHGMGYYDKFLKNYFEKFPQKQTKLIGVGFKEQILDESLLPLDPHDYPLDEVITSD
uniref:5-formyltetrahydrofolate cyclo-ligase n=1 Tax=Corethrella appendiculata TaxID=1370023 RepID=U5EYE0_9DIPT